MLTILSADSSSQIVNLEAKEIDVTWFCRDISYF